jgi:hypothetical protein
MSRLAICNQCFLFPAQRGIVEFQRVTDHHLALDHCERGQFLKKFIGVVKQRETRFAMVRAMDIK